jgi:hypothetical protein
MKGKKVVQHMAGIDTGIFPCRILFCHGFSYDEIMGKLKKQKAPDWVAGLADDKALIDGGRCFSLKREVENKQNQKVTLFYIIITRQFDFSDWDMCMLAHEVLHTCQFMLPDILDRDREFECEAYLHTHIMTQCLKILRT